MARRYTKRSTRGVRKSAGTAKRGYSARRNVRSAPRRGNRSGYSARSGRGPVQTLRIELAGGGATGAITRPLAKPRFSRF